ncbi:Protein of unknown function precursor [Flavobacterium indicum GPTSA100-9 = DSM 17447]|uniref:Uncharacterized protein n=1 Tax=Flavobacterium indicum (strain DSM 17447 / CIP 109464 / GPTSA100-9) TaxID=1094466 RepID=H8XNM5_FLAIG|nr:hypothetical protein [Flavobacterium indicum]CCG52142.1 Protein of unknown function precursor [Flavobacterium indicum GPTSA100-9 = DSM 17447]
MKIQLLLFAFALGINANAQVGINITTPWPEEELHIGGDTSNIRIEGLNAANNPNNLGSSNTSKVFVNEFGDLVLGKLEDNIQMIFDSENYLKDVQNPTSLILQTGEGQGFSQAGIPTLGLAASFTLTKPAIIEVNYSVSWNIGKNVTSTSRIDDFRARVVQTGMYFRKDNYLGAPVVNDYFGNPINGYALCITSTCSEVAGMIAVNGQIYNNNDNNEGEWRSYRNSASDYVVLGPGTYTPMFAAQLEVGDTNSTGAIKMYLGVENDEVQIIAHYFN